MQAFRPCHDFDEGTLAAVALLANLDRPSLPKPCNLQAYWLDSFPDNLHTLCIPDGYRAGV